MESQHRHPLPPFQPSLDAHVALLGCAILLVPVAAARAFHSARPRFFAAPLALSPLLLAVASAGMLGLAGAGPASRPSAAVVAWVLGSLLGPGAAGLALCTAGLEALDGGSAVAVAGPTWRRVSAGLCVIAAAAMAAEAAGAVAMVDNGDTRAALAGLATSLLAVLGSAGLSLRLTCGVLLHVPAKDWSDDAAAGSRLSRTRTWLIALNLASVMLVGHLTYRICELAPGITGSALGQNQTAVILMDELLPLLVVAVATVSPPERDSAAAAAAPPVTELPSLGGQAPPVTPVWDVQHSLGRAVVVVDLEQGRAGGGGGGGRKWGVERVMMVDPDDLW